MGVFGSEQEQRTQLHFRDDGRFEFRKMKMEATFLIEKLDDQIVKGWKHLFKNQYPFPGYKKMGADLITLSYDRDLILDPYGVVTEEELPTKDKKPEQGKHTQPMKEWLVSVGNAQRLKIMAKPSGSTLADKLTIFMGIALVLEIITILVIRGR
jgi:hypothetical protein